MPKTPAKKSSTARTEKIFIGGKWVASQADRCNEVTDPTSNKVIARVPFCNTGDVQKAIAAAAAAFPAWRDTPAPKRVEVLFRLHGIMSQQQELLASMLSREHGKVFIDAMGSVRRGLDMVEYACGAPALLQGDSLENIASGVDCATYRTPLGVCAAITPFNFPIMCPMWFIPIALACGNTMVVKPSETTPLSSLHLAKMFKEAGLPDGVLNMVTGDKEAVDALITHPEVKAVSFVGSMRVGQYVYATASRHGKRVQTLMGAKNHLVAMPDADIEKTVAALIGSAFGSAGERCMAISVCVAVGEIADPLVVRLVEVASRLKVGPGSDRASEMGPVVTGRHKERVVGYIDQGVKEKAALLLDGRNYKVKGYANGNWVGPTVFDHVTPGMKIYQEEIFGPVLAVVRVNTLHEAIDLINAHRYGNGTAIFTDSGLAARTFRNQVNVGMIGVNVPIPVPMAYFPFTGWKDSFHGTLHAHGRDGIQFFSEQKIVTTRWYGPTDAAHLRMGFSSRD